MLIRPWYWPEQGQPERTEPFTWIVEGVIAASWWPDPAVFARFDEEGIKAVVNVCEFDNRRDVPGHFDCHSDQGGERGLIFPARFGLLTKKSPDAVFRGGV